MKVLVITTSYPLEHDGSEAAGSFVADFVRVLGEQCEVSVVCPATRDSSISISGHVFQVPRLPLSLLSPLHPMDWRDIMLTLREGRIAVDKAVREFQPDHILALWALPSGYWASRAAERYEVPFSVWALGSDIWGLGKVPVVKTMLRRVLRQAKWRFADGLQLCEDVTRICAKPSVFLPSSRILPVIEKTGGGGALRFAFLGRWHKNKGVDLLMDALRMLSEEDWSKIGEVRIHGGGPLKEEVMATASELLSKERPVRVGGYLDTREAASLLSWADYLLIPSRIESIPVIFSDALQSGTPMVVSPVGDFPRLFEHTPPGILARDVGPQFFCEAIRMALDTDSSIFLEAVDKKREAFSTAQSASAFLSRIDGVDG